jgi:hypothetical protein
MATGTRSRIGGNSGAVDAGHRRDARRAAVVLGPLAAHAGLAADDRHPEDDEAGDDEQRRRDLADRHDPERHARCERPRAHQGVDAAQQPAIAQADLAPAGGEPTERHPADRPLQQHGGGVEGDHASGGYRRCPKAGAGAYLGAAMSQHPPRPPRPVLRVAAVVALTIALAGCFTGKRPTLAAGPETTGDANVDAVLTRLDKTRIGVFTVGYDILVRFGGTNHTATVVQTGPARRSVTVGNVRFIVDNSDTATCNLESGACSGTIDAARISDTQLAPDFFATSAAVRLRRAVGAKVGPTVPSTATIAGQAATCVAVPVTNATETYCALDDGPLARLDAADVKIEMTSWSSTPDESKFSRSGA